MIKLLRPLITIIIPTYNSESTLQRAIDSVVKQIFNEYELIVIDGASTDQTLEIIRRNETKISKYNSIADSGIYEALNKGVSIATGEWIYILGSDDYLWSPDVFASMAQHLIKDAGKCGIVYGKIAYINFLGETLQLLGVPWQSARLHFFDRMTLPHQGVFHHRSLFERHGMFNETFCMAGDYEFLLRELKTGEAIFVSDIIVAGYQHGGGSSLPENGLKVLHECRKAQRLNGFYWPSFYWLMCYVRTILRMLVLVLFGDKLGASIIDWFRGVFGLSKFWTRI